MNAVIITVGTELTSGKVVDTNAAFLTHKLEQQGIRITLTLTVPDNQQQIGQALQFALKLKPSLVVIAGGLGPTDDDMTAAAVASALQLRLEIHPRAVEMVKKAVGQEKLSPRQIKQATVPAGSQVLEPVGTAPGFVIICEGSVVMVLPGVPLEMKKMWGYACHNPHVAAVLNAAPPPFRRALAFYGPGESQVSEAVQSILGKSRADIEVSICCRYQEVLLEFTASSESQDQIENLMATLKQRFGNAVFSEGEKIEEVIAAELSRQGKTLAVGESCTGGMLGEVITSISGASAFFLGGVIAYSNNVKRDLLKVRQETLDNVGAVSEPVAQQLALGVRALSGADYGIGITGVAGPTGGTPAKPVGLVYICVSSDKGDVVKGFNFPGQRSDVRQAAVTAALHMLHQKLLIDKEDMPYNA